MTALISSDVLAIVALCFTICLAKRNIIVNNYKNRIYISAAVVTIVLLFLEIITILIEPSNNSKFILPYRLANVLGFSLSPVVPFLLYFFNNNKEERILFCNILAIPLYFNILLCFLSYKTGNIFYVDAQNHYTRGNLFLLPTLIAMFYYALMVIAVIKNSEYEMENKKFLIPVILIPVLAVVLQILFRDLILIWSSISLSLLLYYIFLRELQFEYDVQTGIRNRSAFEKEMDQYLKDDKNAAIVVLDLNNLKRTNDQYGHKIGDEMILLAAKIIWESFMSIGKTFRIGGDEFCVICKETPRELVDNALDNLDYSLIAINKERSIKVDLAYGYALYINNKSVSIYTTFTQADKAMYTHKTELKGHYGRRADDHRTAGSESPQNI